MNTLALQEKPRLHYDYFVPAMLTTFIVMTGGWVDAFLHAMAICLHATTI